MIPYILRLLIDYYDWGRELYGPLQRHLKSANKAEEHTYDSYLTVLCGTVWLTTLLRVTELSLIRKTTSKVRSCGFQRLRFTRLLKRYCTKLNIGTTA